MNTPPHGTGTITPMPSPDSNDVKEEEEEEDATEQIDSLHLLCPVKLENDSQLQEQHQLPPSPEVDVSDDTEEVEFLGIFEAKTNPPQQPPQHLCPNQQPQAKQTDAYSRFKDKFFKEDLAVMLSKGNMSIDFNLWEFELQQLNSRLTTVFSMAKTPTQVLNELFPATERVKIIDKGCYGQEHQHVSVIHFLNVGKFLGMGKTRQDARQYAARLTIEFLHKLMFSYEVFQKSKRALESTQNSYQNKHKKLKTTATQPKATQNISPNANSNNVNPIEDFPIDSIPLLDDELSKAIYYAVMKKAAEIFGLTSINQLIHNIPQCSNKKEYAKQNLFRWKELAGFVVVSDRDPSRKVRVLSLGTGTKTIHAEYLSLNGDVVHDCHAEIIARRGLMCVLYEQLQALLDNKLQDKPEFILEPRENGQGFRLKKHLKLHLYISSPPCGDSRMFNFVESFKASRSQLARGVLRVKIEKGQGAVPMPMNYIATWDGILTSCQKSTFMSCSDKVTLWNVVGVQGSLLSFFLEPIYIESLVISRLFRAHHMMRAFYGRINQDILKGKIGENTLYHLSKLKLGNFNPNPVENRNTELGNNPVQSHNWYASCLIAKNGPQQPNKDEVEILKADRGVNFFTQNESRLCKHSLLKRFHQLTTSHLNIPSIIPYNMKRADELEPALRDIDKDIKPFDKRLEIDIKSCSYADLKSGSHLYNHAKIALFSTLKDSGLGSWVNTPVDVDMFLLETE